MRPTAQRRITRRCLSCRVRAASLVGIASHRAALRTPLTLNCLPPLLARAQPSHRVAFRWHTLP
jgi:hypothetical protein